MRTRSPRIAPPVNGLVGSTAITPTVSLGVPGFGREPIDERALAGAGRPGDANEIGPAGVRKDVADQAGRGGGLVLDQRDGAGHRPHVAGSHALGQ